jgi:serine/threonine-protein kinase SRPK3
MSLCGRRLACCACICVCLTRRVLATDSTYPPPACAGGYHPVSINDKYNNGRYSVLRKLGWGHFSTVWLCHDRTSDGLAALKIQKSATHYTEAARDEIEMLSQIRNGDADDSKCCCRLLDTFEHAGPNGKHVCMVFEVLGDNLLALIKLHKYRGIPLDVVRNIARQVLTGLDYLHTCAAPHLHIPPRSF